MAANVFFLAVILIVIAIINLIASIVLLAVLGRRLPKWAKALFIIVLVLSALFLVIFGALALFKGI
ncbi:MAG: hypothetical protein J6P71_03530 [Oscillospiraceae bacterium]|nr:hypothetical protein [Oscillospiraceae bacterium]